MQANFIGGPSGVIRSPKFSVPWAAEVLWSLVVLRVNLRYKETHLGLGWLFLQPVALTVILTYVFHRFVRISSGEIPYPLFVAVGLVAWLFTSLVISHSAFSLSGHQILLKRVALAKILLPLSTVIATGVDLAAMAGLLGVLFVYYGIFLSWAAGWTLILLAIHLALLIGLSCLASLANVFFRDVGQAIPLLLQLWFFASPVFYSTSTVPGEFHALIKWNPMAGLIEGYRSALLFGEPPSLEFVGPAFLVSIAAVLIGFVSFWRFEGRVTDVL